MAKKPKDAISGDRVAMLGRIAARMTDKIKELDATWTVDGMHTLPHKTKEKGYRNLPVNVEQEFMLHSAYVGARGQLIFCFEPADSQDYDYIEVDEKRMDEVFPLVGPAYAAAIKVEGEDFKLMILATEQQILAEDEAAAKAEQEAKEAADQEYTTNPLFGRF